MASTARPVKQINPYEKFARVFWPVLEEFFYGDRYEFILHGGRGSTKSTAVGELIPMGMIADATRGEHTHAIVFRRYANDLADSVFAQMQKSIAILGLESVFRSTVKPMQLTYIPTGQTIQFEGLDDPLKLKSRTPKKGYYKYLWFEEYPEFNGIDDILSVRQSILRGGNEFKIFRTMNPPQDATHWANVDLMSTQPHIMIHKSCYTDVPKEWNGPEFWREAEALKVKDYKKYEWMYLGEPNGLEGKVFQNIINRRIEQSEINNLERLSCGLDWGFAADPAAIVWLGWQANRRRLYLLDEVYGRGMSNHQLAQKIHEKQWKRIVICDNAEPKSIADLNSDREYPVRAIGCRKGKGSLPRGMRWLAHTVDEIVIDDLRTPNAFREFNSYAYQKDASGDYIKEYVDAKNHTIDATRYGAQDWMTVMTIR